MKLYELVLVIKAGMNADEKTELLTTVEGLIGSDTIKQKDDIGVLKTAYPLQGKRENTHAHYVSYLLELEPQKVNELTKKFAFVKGLMRHFFYVLGNNEEFVSYAQMQEKLKFITEVKEAKKNK